MNNQLKRYFRQAKHKQRGGRSYKTELENLQVILAHQAEAITWLQLCEFFGLDPGEYTTLAKLDDIRQSAVEAGVRLAK